MKKTALKTTTLLFISTLLLPACVGTTYTSFEAADNSVPLLARQVRYDLSQDFFRDPPTCITILPAGGTAPAPVKTMVERSVAQHMSTKVSRVIGPLERQRLVRKLAVDLGNDQDRKSFSALARCRFYAKTEILSVENSYVVFWSQREFGLTVSLLRGPDSKVVWKASHRATRGDGGLPLSPLSLGTAVAEAGWSFSDNDALPSMIDDSLRRIAITLPDTR